MSNKSCCHYCNTENVGSFYDMSLRPQKHDYDSNGFTYKSFDIQHQYASIFFDNEKICFKCSEDIINNEIMHNSVYDFLMIMDQVKQLKKIDIGEIIVFYTCNYTIENYDDVDLSMDINISGIKYKFDSIDSFLSLYGSLMKYFNKKLEKSLIDIRKRINDNELSFLVHSLETQSIVADAILKNKFTYTSIGKIMGLSPTKVSNAVKELGLNISSGSIYLHNKRYIDLLHKIRYYYKPKKFMHRLPNQAI